MGYTPFTVAKDGGEPIIERVPLASIKVDTYQGNTLPNRVRSIVSKFDPSIFQPVTISLRDDGDMFVMDGKHRCAAAMALGHDTILGLIYVGFTYEDEARFFAETQRPSNRRSLRAIDLFRARAEYREPQATAITALLDRHGLRVARTNARGVGEVGATDALDRAYQLLGAERLDEVLSIICSSWPDNIDATTGNVISGTAGFWRRYRGRVSEDDLVASLRRVTPVALVAHGRSLGSAVSTNTPSGVGMTILAHYNKSRRSGRLPEWTTHSRDVNT